MGVGAHATTRVMGQFGEGERLKKEAYLDSADLRIAVTLPRSSHPAIEGADALKGIWGCGPGKSNRKAAAVRRSDPTATQGPSAPMAVAAPAGA